MAALTGITEKDAYLAVFDAPGGATVLTLHPSRMRAFFDKARFIHNKYTVLIAQMFCHIVPQNIAGGVDIPVSSLQQMLNSIRRAFAYPFRQLPAIFTFNVTEQPPEICEAALLWARMVKQGSQTSME